MKFRRKKDAGKAKVAGSQADRNLPVQRPPAAGAHAPASGRLRPTHAAAAKYPLAVSEDTQTMQDESDAAECAAASPQRAARLRERARCHAIMSHPAAKGIEGIAATLAFETNMPRHKACRMLGATPRPAMGGMAGPIRGQPWRDGGRIAANSNDGTHRMN